MQNNNSGENQKEKVSDDEQVELPDLDKNPPTAMIGGYEEGGLPPNATFPKNWDEIKKQAESSETEPNEPEPSDQILFEMKIIRATDDFLDFVGLDANSLSKSETWTKYRVTDSNNSASFIIDELNTDLLKKAAAARKDCRMVVAPRVNAVNGRTSTVSIVDQEYYILKPPAESNDPAEKKKTELQEISTGTTIQLTPELTEGRKNIQLNLNIKFNNLVEFQETKIGGKKMLVPKISTLEDTSRILIPNNKILLIRGEKITRTTSGKSKTPVLGNLPLIGGAFRNQYKITEEYTPLILVQPSFYGFGKKQIKQPETVDPNDSIIERLEARLSR
jgi:type II secretory pathway component GspD/PulD (secretin)